MLRRHFTVCIVWCMQRDLGEISELKQQLMKVAKRDNAVRSELSDQKKTIEASAASVAEKLKTAQKEKLELETALDKACVISVAVFVFLVMI